MKNFIKIGAIALSFSLLACAGTELEEKKKSLTELKKETSELRAKLKENEKQIIMLEAFVAKNEGKSPNALVSKLISVQTLEPQKFEHFLEFQGNVVSDENLSITAKGMGTLTKVYVKKGDRVRPGTLVAIIDDEAFNKQIAALMPQLNNAKLMYEKQKALYEQNVGTQVQYEGAKTAYESIQENLNVLKHQQSETTRIVAKANGTVQEVYAHTGDNVAPGVPICQLLGSGAMKLKSDIAESYAKDVKLGSIAEIDFPDYNKTINSRVVLVDNVINPMKRSFEVQFDARAAQGMKANTTMNAKIKDYSNLKAIVVPTSCIMHESGKAYVFVLDASKKAKKVYVTKGISQDGKTEISTGLSKGDQVIVTGYQDITEGEAVKLN
jgi:membrane fusion protein, multidrug efflux system